MTAAAAMVITIDDCRECRRHVAEHGSVVICMAGDTATARNLFVSEWGPAYVTDCPLGHVSETTEDGAAPGGL